jgi:hypothetical protein
MANIVVLRSDWYAVGDATFLQPGDTHPWTWGLGNLLETVSVTAQPVRSTTTEYKVRVEGLQVVGGSDTGRLEFWVRNVGANPVEAYALIASFISQ